MKKMVLTLIWPSLFLGLFSSVGSARDKIGNGGGAWLCQGTDSRDLVFVDLFEAEAEMLWPMRDFSESGYLQIIGQIEGETQRLFSDVGLEWSRNVKTIIQEKKMIDAELEVVDDALYRARPLAKGCSSGRWEYSQLANFNQFGFVTIRKDLWEDPSFSEQERAALIWHEALYLWLREKFKDENSVRARYITGLLFSALPFDEKSARYSEVMANERPHPPPESGGWFCMVKHGLTHIYYGAYSQAKFLAQAKAKESCQLSGNGIHCREDQMRCDEMNKSLSHACSIRNTSSLRDYIGQGHSLTEAMYIAHQTCQKADPSMVFFCEESTIKCEKTGASPPQ